MNRELTTLSGFIPREDGKVPDTEYDVVVVDDYSQNLFDDLKPVISLGNRKIAFFNAVKDSPGSGYI